MSALEANHPGTDTMTPAIPIQAIVEPTVTGVGQGAGEAAELGDDQGRLPCMQ